MPALLVYLLKVNIALLVFCGCYYAILRQLTFYTLNRIYLLLALCFSTIYPFINLSNLFIHPEKIERQIRIIVIDINNYATPVAMAKPITQVTSYWQWVELAFWLGVILMGARLIVQLLSLYKIFRSSSVSTIHQQQVRIIDRHTTPFSFWQSIFINPKLHSDTELGSIIRHEQVHLRQWHSLDTLLAEIALLAYWFNPAAWLIKNAINENLEFITDRAILQQGADRKSYQYNLLHVNFTAPSNTIVNHFNISTLKRRIIMMNVKRSSAINLSRYAIIAPLVAVLLLCFNFSEAALTTKKQLLKNLAAAVKVVNYLPPTKVPKPSELPVNNKFEVKKVTENNKEALLASTTDTVKKQPVKVQDVPSPNPDDYIFYLDDQLMSKEQLKHWDMHGILVMIPLSVDETEKVFGVRKRAGVNITVKNKDSEATKTLLAKIEDAQGRKIALPGSVNGSVDAALAKTPVTVVGTDGIIYDNESSDKSPITLNLAQFKKTGVLVVIDDRQLSPDRLENFNALSGQNISSVSFLNKEDATAKYGDKGNKGAVLITTTFFKNKPKN